MNAATYRLSGVLITLCWLDHISSRPLLFPLPRSPSSSPASHSCHLSPSFLPSFSLSSFFVSFSCIKDFSRLYTCCRYTQVCSKGRLGNRIAISHACSQPSLVLGASSSQGDGNSCLSWWAEKVLMGPAQPAPSWRSCNGTSLVSAPTIMKALNGVSCGCAVFKHLCPFPLTAL